MGAVVTLIRTMVAGKFQRPTAPGTTLTSYLLLKLCMACPRVHNYPRSCLYRVSSTHPVHAGYHQRQSRSGGCWDMALSRSSQGPKDQAKDHRGPFVWWNKSESREYRLHRAWEFRWHDYQYEHQSRRLLFVFIMEVRRSLNISLIFRIVCIWAYEGVVYTWSKFLGTWQHFIDAFDLTLQKALGPLYPPLSSR